MVISLDPPSLCIREILEFEAICTWVWDRDYLLFFLTVELPHCVVLAMFLYISPPFAWQIVCKRDYYANAYHNHLLDFSKAARQSGMKSLDTAIVR